MSDEQHDDMWSIMLRKRLRAHGWKDGERKFGQRAWRDPGGSVIVEFDALKIAETLDDPAE